MSDDMWTLVNIASWMIAIVIWSIVLADTKVGAWITGNPVSRRFILPLWEQIKRPVRWMAQRAADSRRVG
jgi:hypothetical protein